MSTTPITSSVGPSTPLNRIQIHSSIPSHLSTELSFLQTLLLRARDQHRTQLFLRRMYEVLRIGKLLLRYVKVASSDDEVKWAKKKLRGEQLIYRAIKSLFTAQRFTSQIIELHHFLPLQTSVLAIYSRLFTITMNIANGLGMDLELLITSGGGLNKSKVKKRSISIQEREVKVNSNIVKGDTQQDEMIMDIEGFEIGEKIERSTSIKPIISAVETPTMRKSDSTMAISSSNSPETSRLANPRLIPPSIMQSSSGLSSPSASSPNVSKQQKIPSQESHPISTPNSPKFPIMDSVAFPAGNTPNSLEMGLKKKKKKRPLDVGSIFEIPDKPKEQNNLPELSMSSSGKEKTIKVKNKKFQHNKEEGKADNINQKSKIVKKKKKKDAMDDIFGF